MSTAQNTVRLTDEQRVGQLMFTLSMYNLGLNASERVKRCRTAIRKVLERIRDGIANDKEIAAVRHAVEYMNSHAPRPEDKRQLYALTMRYLASEPMTAKELAIRLSIDKSTVQRDIIAVLERMSVLMFGVDAIAWK